MTEIEYRPDADDRQPLAPDPDPEQEFELDRKEWLDPQMDLASGDDWSLNQHCRLLMRLLHDAVNDHISTGDFIPSRELERAMANVKAELDWN